MTSKILRTILPKLCKILPQVLTRNTVQSYNYCMILQKILRDLKFDLPWSCDPKTAPQFDFAFLQDMTRLWRFLALIILQDYNSYTITDVMLRSVTWVYFGLFLLILDLYYSDHAKRFWFLDHSWIINEPGSFCVSISLEVSKLTKIPNHRLLSC